MHFRPRRVLAHVAALLLAAASVAAAPSRLVFISWDGVGAATADRLMAEGHMPNLAALAGRGVRAKGVVPSYPSKTAAAHAALFTGAWGDVNGVTGNAVPLLPRREHTILERTSGYASSALTAEPFYLTLALSGRRTVVLSAPQSYPPDPYRRALEAAGVADDRLVVMSGFEHPIAGPKVHGADELEPVAQPWGGDVPTADARELDFLVGDTPFFALVFDDPADPTEGFDTVWIRAGSRAADATAVLEPAPAGDRLDAWSAPIAVRRGAAEGLVMFRLFELAPDGSSMVLYQRSVNALAGSDPAVTAAYLRASGGFFDDAFDEYARGMLGPPLWRGGDGTAEARVVETVRMDCALLRRGTRYALGEMGAEVLIHYSPAADSAGHVWMGALDPSSPVFDAGLAARLWPYYADVLDALDGWLGDTVKAAGPDAAVVVVSDHGMAPVGRMLNVNRILEDAGLLVRSEDGGIDLARTRALAPAWGAQVVAVNSTDWQNGCVEPDDRDAVLDAVEAALLGRRDPETGAPLVTAVFRPSRTAGLGIGGPAGGDLYFAVAPGLYPSQRLGGEVVEPARGTIGFGNHGFFPYRKSMQALFVGAGPGLRRGVEVSTALQIEVAPTVLALFGVEPPSTMCGHSLFDALAGARP